MVAIMASALGYSALSLNDRSGETKLLESGRLLSVYLESIYRDARHHNAELMLTIDRQQHSFSTGEGPSQLNSFSLKEGVELSEVHGAQGSFYDEDNFDITISKQGLSESLQFVLSYKDLEPVWVTWKLKGAITQVEKGSTEQWLEDVERF